MMILSHCLYCPETDEFSIEAPLEDCLTEANRRNAGIRRDDPAPSWIVVPQESRMLGSVEAIVATEAKMFFRETLTSEELETIYGE